MKHLLLLICFLSSIHVFAQTLRFSTPAGFYDGPFYLKVESSEGAVKYQIDLRNSPLDFPDSLLIDKTTNLSIELVVGDSIIKKGSFSYFMNFDTDFKVVSLTINDDFLFDNSIGIYVKGERAYYDTAKKRFCNTNFEKSWERETFVEVFSESGERLVSQSSGLKIFGGMTKYYPEKSLRIVARDKYGGDDFNADIFGLGITEYKHLLLRHSGNDYRSLRFKDALLTSLARESGLDTQASSPSHLFVNSEYWGVYNIREKINKHYIANNNDCGIKGIDILQGRLVLDEGDTKAYKELLAFSIKEDLNDSANYKHIQTLMDTRNFINYWVHQIFYSNHDARGNIRFWRSDSLDGRFRWIVYDTDLGFRNSLVSANLLRDFTSAKGDHWFNPQWATALMRSLMENPSFRQDFINQSSIILSSTLSPEHIINRIEEFQVRYEDEMSIHYNARRKFQLNQGNINRWHKNIEDMRFFAEHRPDYYIRHLEKKFGLENSFAIDLSVKNGSHGGVMLNENTVDSNFYGNLYSDYSIPLSAIPDLGYRSTIWANYPESIDSLLRGEIHHTINDTLEIKIEFIKLPNSETKILFNEISQSENALEFYNPREKSVDLSGWTLTNNSNYSVTIKDLTIPSSNYGSLFLSSIDSSHVFPSTSLYLFDDKNQFVDSLSKHQWNSTGTLLEDSGSELQKNFLGNYSRSFPLDYLGDRLNYWICDSTISIGFENPSYTTFLAQIEKNEALEILDNRNKTIYILLLCFVASGAIFSVLFGKS
jgi:hypothetical protein